MKYTGERPNQLSVPNDLKFPHLLFAEETPHFRHILFENLNVCKTGGIGLQPIPPADFLFMLPFAEIAGCGYCSL